MEHIGTLQEGPLHAALKDWCSEPGDRFEHPVDGLVIDIVRDDLLVEIQTGGFTPLRRKLERLLPDHRVRIVHPVAIDTWIMKMGEGGEILSRRKSPRHDDVFTIFSGLVSITDHLAADGLEIDVVLTRQEQVRRHEPGKAWRRKGWVINHRRLIEVLDVVELRSPTDVLGLLPDELPEPFTTADLAETAGITRRSAQQVCYCLKAIELIEAVGVRNRSPEYVRIR